MCQSAEKMNEFKKQASVRLADPKLPAADKKRALNKLFELVEAPEGGGKSMMASVRQPVSIPRPPGSLHLCVRSLLPAR